MEHVEISHELLDQYNRPGPRYTSYPTVPYWTTEFTADDYRQTLQNLAARPNDLLSVYVHLPFCSTRCYYCGCTSAMTTRPEVVDTYLDHVEQELALVLEHLGTNRRVVQVHWGGGTPNFLTPPQMERLVSLLERSFAIDHSGEIAIEIDPRIASREQIEHIRRLGFNRISMGVQDFNPVVQEAIGRIQPQALTEHLYGVCRELEFDSVNMDLIYGLPAQTADTYRQTLHDIIKLSPDRIACFSYAHLPESRANQKRIDSDLLPNHYEKFALFRMSIDMFTDAGYDWIGMDHFAKHDDELSIALRQRQLHRNFMGYTTRPALHQLALGMSGISDIAGCFAQNDAKLGPYQKSVAAGRLPIVRGKRLTDDDHIRRRVIMHLMCNLELPYDLTTAEFGVSLREAFGDELERLSPYEAEGFVTFEPDRVAVTTLGRYFIRNVSMEFDPYLKQNRERPMFSRTI